MTDGLAILPLTQDLWPQLERMFEADGITRGCWCMFWRHERGLKGTPAEDRRPAFAARVADGPRPPGLVALDDTGAAAWVQITPRTELPRFQRVPTARPAADTRGDTWAVSCFFVRKDRRGTGLMTRLAAAACDFAASHGASAVEAAARRETASMMWGDGFVGIVPALGRAGFVEVEARTPQRVLMRWTPPAP